MNKNKIEQMRIIFKKLPALLLVSGLIIFGSCKEAKKLKDDKSNIEIQKKSDTTINKDLLVGSWLDSSEAALHFTMFEDGTARSDNMETLLYEKWRLEGDKLIITAKSIGNGSSSVGDDVYEIQELTDKKMILKNGEYFLEFVKKK